MLHGKKARKSLDLRSWEGGQKLIREMEANPNAVVAVKEACEKFIADAKARNLSDGMVRKLNNLTKELEKRFGTISLRSLSVDDVRKMTHEWKLAPITKQKRLEILRGFFRFCVDSGWIDRNPGKAIRSPIVKHRPTLPFSENDMERIFWACEVVREKHPQMKLGIEKKLRALVLLMRHSGLRISDAVILTDDRIRDGKLFLYQAKTDEPVWVPIAGVYDPHSHNQSHRLRDTFAVGLLEKGIARNRLNSIRPQKYPGHATSLQPLGEKQTVGARSSGAGGSEVRAAFLIGLMRR
jgi:site-specific recombinase XerD